MLDADGLAEGEELESNILSQDFALVRSSYQKFTKPPVTGIPSSPTPGSKAATDATGIMAQTPQELSQPHP